MATPPGPGASPKVAPWRPGPPPYDLRCVINGLVYLRKTGCQWRLLPREVGKWNTPPASCNRWRRAGVWARVMEALRQLERRRVGRHSEPSAGSGDRQSIKTATQPSEVGLDGGKNLKGRRWHLLVDTRGLSTAVVVTAANIDDRLGSVVRLTRYFAGGIKRLRKLWVDGGYRAEGGTSWVRDVKATHKIDLEVTDKAGTGLQVIPWRWAVERPFHGS
jgi:putative transposase